MKKVFGTLVYLFCCAMFIVPAVWIYLGLLRPAGEANRVLKNGTETTAILTEIGPHLTVTSNDTFSGESKEHHYALELAFADAAGEQLLYKSGRIYPEEFIRQMGLAEYNEASGRYDIPTREAVPVIALGDKALVKGFDPGDSTPSWLWVLVVVFSLVGIGMLLALLVGLKKSLTAAVGAAMPAMRRMQERLQAQVDAEERSKKNNI